MVFGIKLGINFLKIELVYLVYLTGIAVPSQPAQPIIFGDTMEAGFAHLLPRKSLLMSPQVKVLHTGDQ